VTFTISADDPRTIRAIEIAAGAEHWLSGHNADGREVFAVPSQSAPDTYHIVTCDTCDCPDYRHHTLEPGSEHLCKHILAVRLHCELARAQQHVRPQPARRSSAADTQRRRHLSVVPRAD
jgi:hypothetical protein